MVIGIEIFTFVRNRPPGKFSVKSNHAIDSLILDQDIDFKNILVNQFAHTHTHTPSIRGAICDEEARICLPNKGQIRYCLFDFDLSHIFPPAQGASVSDCLLPSASVQGRGSYHHLPSSLYTDCVDQKLDPFKFDVACMGNMLRRYYVSHFLCKPHLQMMILGNGPQYLIPAFSFLAPLLDPMTTEDMAIRFTASECRSVNSSGAA